MNLRKNLIRLLCAALALLCLVSFSGNALAVGVNGYVTGDINGDGAVNHDDTVYLLLSIMFGEEIYPVKSAPMDMDRNGKVSWDDAVYLLLHVEFGEASYPLNPPATGENMLVSTNTIKNIILIIGDGMGLNHIQAGQLYDGITYNFTNWDMVRVNTYPLEDASGALSEDPTDSAASATAMATGVLTTNGRLGNDIDNNQLPTILDLANSLGKATGIVTTDTLAGHTPGAFSAHASYRDNVDEILPTQMTSGVNLLCGFAEQRYHWVADQWRDAGYAYIEDFADVEDTYSSEYAMWQLDTYGVDARVPLQDVTPKALEYLSQDPDGFVLMLEQAHPDKYSHNNSFDKVCKSVSDLNKTVETVMQWVGDRTDTMVLVVADHETGGLVISEKPDKYSQRATYHGVTFYYEFRSTNHTGTNVALYVYGVKADFTRSPLYSKKALKNTGVYYLMEEALMQAKNRN